MLWLAYSQGVGVGSKAQNPCRHSTGIPTEIPWEVWQEGEKQAVLTVQWRGRCLSPLLRFLLKCTHKKILGLDHLKTLCSWTFFKHSNNQRESCAAKWIVTKTLHD